MKGTVLSRVGVVTAIAGPLPGVTPGSGSTLQGSPVQGDGTNLAIDRRNAGCVDTIADGLSLLFEWRAPEPFPMGTKIHFVQPGQSM